MDSLPFHAKADAWAGALSEHWNAERMMVALIGGGLIVAGVNLYKTDQPTVLGGQDKKPIAGLLFSLGWLLIALSTIYRHSLSTRGVIEEPLSAKSLLAFASAIAVVSGAMMVRAEHDADPMAEASGMAQSLFLGGWLGITMAMMAESIVPLVFHSNTKVALVAVGVLTTLGGIVSTRGYELQSAIEFAEGDFTSAVDKTRDWPKWLFGLGWIVIAMGIGYHN